MLCARSEGSGANYSRSGSRERMQLFLVLLLQHPWWNSEFTESWLFSFYWQRNCKLNYSQGSSVNYFHRSGERRWQKINIQPHCFCNEEKKITPTELCSLSTPRPLLGFRRVERPSLILAHIACLLKVFSSLSLFSHSPPGIFIHPV